MNYRIVVMTYKRKDFKALNLLKLDDSFDLWLAVRKEEYENGFYDHLKFNPRIKFLLLENVTDAGDTRQRIIDICYKNGVDFVAMLDDTVEAIYDPNGISTTVAECVEDTIAMMLDDIHADRIMCSVFMKRANVRHDIYTGFFVQAAVINIKKLMEESTVRFRKVKDCGFDDFTFTYELHSKGWFIIQSHCVRKCRSWMPHKATLGGTHDSIDMTHLMSVNDDRCRRTKSFLETMYTSPAINFCHYDVNIDGTDYKFLSLKAIFTLKGMLKCSDKGERI